MNTGDQTHRRSIRVRGYDYRLPGAYFVTICTHEKAYLLGEIIDGTLRYSRVGLVAKECWAEIPGHFPRVQLDAHVIMPNHLHGILVFTGIPEKGTPWRAPTTLVSGMSARAPTTPVSGMPRRAPTSATFGKPASGSLATIINLFKASVTKQVRKTCVLTGRDEPPIIWQRNYYEHIIRNERSLNKIREYVCQNPARWQFDPENPARTETRSVDEIAGINGLDWD